MGGAKRAEKTVASCLWLPEEISKVSENNFDHVIRVMFGFSTKHQRSYPANDGGLNYTH